MEVLLTSLPFQKRDAKTLKSLTRLRSYQKHLERIATSRSWEELESSICLPADKTAQRQIASFLAKQSRTRLKYILLIGIGGSCLGAKAIYDALRTVSDLPEVESKFPRLICVDTCHPSLITTVETLLSKLASWEELACLVVSKSGTTTETVLNAELLLSLFLKRFSKHLPVMAVITDRDSPLWNLGIQRSIPVFEIPKRVGGRYSIFSSVGLLPLALSGIRVGPLLRGAQHAVRDALFSEVSANSAIQTALRLDAFVQQGTSILNLFFFHPSLESVGKWQRQLLAESLGKEKIESTGVTRTGMLPIVSLGTTDLHSLLQFYLAGPRTALTSFVWMPPTSRHTIPMKRTILETISEPYRGFTDAQVFESIYQATQQTYQKLQLPFMELRLAEKSEVELGYYLQFWMITTMYLAHLWNISAFDQPHVELYKSEARRILRNR